MIYLLLFGGLLAGFLHEAQAVTLVNPLGAPSIMVFIDRLINVLFTLGIPIASLMILWSALLFLTSGGDPGKVKSAKSTLLYAMVGFVILLLSKGIIYFICTFFLGVGC